MKEQQPNQLLLNRREVFDALTGMGLALTGAGSIEAKKHHHKHHRKHHKKHHRHHPVKDPQKPGEPTKPYEVTVWEHGDRNKSLVYLTFDDGWNAPQTERLLDLTKQHNTKLTFFPVGEAVDANPELWRDVYRAGHEIENHTYSHADLRKKTRAEIADEIKQQRDAVGRAVQDSRYKQYFLRPPNGHGFFPSPDDDEQISQWQDILTVLSENELDAAIWNLYSYDWDAPEFDEFDQSTDSETEGKMLHEITTRARGGSIILQHTIKPDVDILEEEIIYLRSQSLTPVTLFQGLK